MNNRSNNNKDRRLYYIIAVLLILISIPFFSFHRIADNQLADNPQGCRYYITLLSLLSNYQSLASDKANADYIKNRIFQFEKDINHAKKSPDIINEYKNKYHAVLNQFGVKSIKSVRAEDSIAVADKSYDFIDGYYLDDRLYCINPLYFQVASHSRRILQYNFGGLYYRIPDRHSRILVAFPNDSQLGVFSGSFVNNQTTALETQFETGMPLLTALYVLPKYDFSKIGAYTASVPWGYFGIDSITDPLTRKVLNIAGIDIFSVLKSYMAVKHLKGFVDATPIESSIRPMFGGDAQSFINQQSYGMAYLANHISAMKKNEMEPHESAIKAYFSVKGERDPKLFTAQTDFLYGKLMGLKSKRDIILESDTSTTLTSSEMNRSPGSVTIKGIVGPRAMFDVNCNRSVCTFVYNVSAAPGWHAFVNGHPTTIQRANFAFMATSVPAGHSTVWFIYEPVPALFGYFLSILSLILILGSGIIMIKNRK